MKTAQFGLLAMVLSTTLSAQANFAQLPELPKIKIQQLDSKYLQIGSVEVTELATEEFKMDRRQFSAAGIGTAGCSPVRGSFSGPLNNLEKGSGEGDWIGETGTAVDRVDMIVDKVINIGKKIWAVVEKGRPVVNVRADVATALPAGAKCWLDLQTWRAPVSKTWGISFKNLYGVEVVRYVYRVIYLAGGSVDGVGQYIGYATVQPVELNVAWGYTFNSEVTVPAVYNMGSRSNPIGGLTLEVKWSVETVLKKTIQTQSYSVDGRGTLTQLQ